MTKREQLIEGNKLIMLFHGWEKKTRHSLVGKGEYVVFVKDGFEVREEDIEFDIVYRQSWDALMPVVEKIESINDPHHGHFGVHISSNSCTIQATNFRSGNPMGDPPYYFADWTHDTKLLATWQAIVSFIRWLHSEQSPEECDASKAP